MAALVEFSMTPIGAGESVSAFVADSLKIVSESGVAYRLGPMGTVLEGEWSEVMAVIRRCHEHMSGRCNRISCSIKVDWRRDATGRLDAKVAKVERLLGRELRK